MRDYQSNIKEKLDSKEFRRFLLAWPRRSGKDKFAIQLCMDKCLESKSVVYYVVPMLRMARNSSPFTDLKNTDEYVFHVKDMFIEFANGSSITFLGEENSEKVGLFPPNLCIFSEYSMIDPALASKIAAVCDDSGGNSIFIGTPFLKEDDPMRVLYNKVKDDKNWYTEALTIDDTKHMPPDYIKEQIDNGLISEEAKQKEFYPSL